MCSLYVTLGTNACTFVELRRKKASRFLQDSFNEVFWQHPQIFLLSKALSKYLQISKTLTCPENILFIRCWADHWLGMKSFIVRFLLDAPSKNVLWFLNHCSRAYVLYNFVASAVGWKLRLSSLPEGYSRRSNLNLQEWARCVSFWSSIIMYM